MGMIANRTTLRQRIQLLVVALTIGMFAVVLIAPLAIRARDEAAQEIRATIEPMRQSVMVLQRALAEQESAVRGFVLTSDERALGPYTAAQEQMADEFAQLRALTADDAVLRVRTEEAAAAAARWEAEVAEPSIRLVRGDQAAAAVELEGTGTPYALANDARDAVEELRLALIADAQQADEQAVAARNRLSLLFVGLGLAGAGAVVATSMLLGRWVRQPLEEISHAVAAVTRGDQHRQIPVLGPSDIADLARNVESMRAETVRRLDEAERAREALEQQGPAVVTLRAELSPSPVRYPEGVYVESAFEPALGVLAGDWYDTVVQPDGRVLLLMVDVSGHGPDSGVFALRAKHLLGATLADDQAPGEALTWTARHIGETGERFLTGVVIELDPATGRVRYANAGHPSPVVIGAGLATLPATGPLLGPLPGTWETKETHLPVGAAILAYTDGLIEARDSAGEEYGEERLWATLAEMERVGRVKPELCVQQVREYSGGRLVDDVTVTVLGRT